MHSTVPFRPIRAVVVRNSLVSVHGASRRTQNDTGAYVREVWLTTITVRCDREILVVIPSSFFTQACQDADVRGSGSAAAAGQAPRVDLCPGAGRAAGGGLGSSGQTSTGQATPSTTR